METVKLKSKAKIIRHGTDPDWCHICGERKTKTADVSYPENAEHPENKPSQGKYVRICDGCAEEIAAVARL